MDSESQHEARKWHPNGNKRVFWFHSSSHLTAMSLLPYHCDFLSVVFILQSCLSIPFIFKWPPPNSYRKSTTSFCIDAPPDTLWFLICLLSDLSLRGWHLSLASKPSESTLWNPVCAEHSGLLAMLLPDAKFSISEVDKAFHQDRHQFRIPVTSWVFLPLLKKQYPLLYVCNISYNEGLFAI